MEGMTKRETTNSDITIKGTRDGLLVTIGEGRLSDLLAELAKRLGRTASFFKGGHVSLQVGRRKLSVAELEEIKALLSQNGVSLRAVLTTSPITRAAARSLGLQTGAKPVTEPSPPRDATQGIVVQRTLRSGQIVQHPGHIVIIGDVNPGAEVVAGGNVVVWGKLRGMVHAGAMGDDSAMVCALSLAPTQLRIGNHIARPPEGGERPSAIPEVAQVKEGKIIVEAWR